MLTKYDEHFLKEWEKIEQKGRLFYSLRTGIPQSLFYLFMFKLTYLIKSSFSETFLSAEFLYHTIIFMFIGVFGQFTIGWFWRRNIVRKLKNK